MVLRVPPGSLGLDLNKSDVVPLVERTEGWPAELCLAALSLAGPEDRSWLDSGVGHTKPSTGHGRRWRASLLQLRSLLPSC